MPGFPMHPQLPELAQTPVWKGQRYNCSQRPLKCSSQILNRYRGNFTLWYILRASFSQLFFSLKFLLHREISAMRVTLTAFVSHVISMTNLLVTSLPVWTSDLMACSDHIWSCHSWSPPLHGSEISLLLASRHRCQCSTRAVQSQASSEQEK